MRLFNTLSRRVEDFKPINGRQVSLYTCGPTVYDHQTIGNLRTYALYDTLKRTLATEGFSVNHVMNITDVGHLTSDADEGEDKLEKGAKETGQNVWQVAEKYTEEFKADLKQLNIPLPKLAKATDYIEQQISMVRILLDKGFAYQTEQAIYFDISKLDGYGELTGQKLSDKEVAARSEVITDPNKKNPQDFAVWFFRTGHFKDHTMHWPSPWGDGFPGWHLECSAIVHETLGDPIDIHMGAVDLIGTHHTNEIAQTKAAFGHQLANYWVHGEHLLVDGQRMGKSLGNFYTLKDVIDKGYDPLALRLLYLQAHYRTQLNFTWESLEAAQNFLLGLRAWADLVFQPQLGHKRGVGERYPELLKKIKEAIADDLNSAQALSVVSELAAGAEHSGVDAEKLKLLLKELDALLGLSLADRQDIDDKAKDLIKERKSAREAKDWPRADELRTELSAQGIEINDTPHGPVWSRRN